MRVPIIRGAAVLCHFFLVIVNTAVLGHTTKSFAPGPGNGPLGRVSTLPGKPSLTLDSGHGHPNLVPKTTTQAVAEEKRGNFDLFPWATLPPASYKVWSGQPPTDLPTVKPPQARGELEETSCIILKGEGPGPTCVPTHTSSEKVCYYIRDVQHCFPVATPTPISYADKHDGASTHSYGGEKRAAVTPTAGKFPHTAITSICWPSLETMAPSARESFWEALYEAQNFVTPREVVAVKPTTTSPKGPSGFAIPWESITTIFDKRDEGITTAPPSPLHTITKIIVTAFNTFTPPSFGPPKFAKKDEEATGPGWWSTFGYTGHRDSSQTLSYHEPNSFETRTKTEAGYKAGTESHHRPELWSLYDTFYSGPTATGSYNPDQTASEPSLERRKCKSSNCIGAIECNSGQVASNVAWCGGSFSACCPKDHPSLKYENWQLRCYSGNSKGGAPHGALACNTEQGWIGPEAGEYGGCLINSNFPNC
jgi:hypothetical protein